MGGLRCQLSSILKGEMLLALSSCRSPSGIELAMLYGAEMMGRDGRGGVEGRRRRKGGGGGGWRRGQFESESLDLHLS